MMQCIFCNKPVTEDYSIPDFWIDEKSYTGPVCDLCVRSWMTYNKQNLDYEIRRGLKASALRLINYSRKRR